MSVKVKLSTMWAPSTPLNAGCCAAGIGSICMKLLKKQGALSFSGRADGTLCVVQARSGVDKGVWPQGHYG